MSLPVVFHVGSHVAILALCPGSFPQAVAKTLLAPKVSEAVQRLGEVQPDVLPLLCGGSGRSLAMAGNALGVVRSVP